MEPTSRLHRWHQWEVLLAGGEVDTLDTAHLLEEPSEYQLRRLLRAAPHRDELLDRFTAWLSPAEVLLDDSKTVDLARDCVHELRRLRAERELDVEFPAGELVLIDHEASEAGARPADPSEQVLEAAVDSADELHEQPLARALWHVAIATNAPRAVALHLCGPLLTPSISLPAHITFARHGVTVWVDPAAVHLNSALDRRRDDGERRPLSHGGSPSWPTNAEVAAHVADERAALDPATAAGELVELAGSGSPFVRPQLAQHPNLNRKLAEVLVTDTDPRVRGALAANPATPDAVLSRLASDIDPWVRSRAVANPAIPAGDRTADADNDGVADPQELRALVARPDASAELLARALGHPDSQVRQALAQRSDLSLPIIEQLARDPEVYVRSKIADNRLTPEHVLERLRNDEHRLVRRRAER